MNKQRYQPSVTKKGPGRMHQLPVVDRGPGFVIRGENPAGTKLIKRFIKDATGDARDYRRMLKRIQPEHKLVAAV